MVGKAPEGPGKGPKKILKILFLEKNLESVCVVGCRRIDVKVSRNVGSAVVIP